LPKAIDSVIGQTYKNIEIIIIDDGSTDETEQVAKIYVNKHSNIYYHKQKNLGIVKTRNQGVKLASGYYLVQLDADDWIDKNYIEKAVNIAEKNNVDIVYSDVMIFGRENKTVKYPEHDIEILKYQNYIHVSALVKKTILSSKSYDEALENLGYEDWDLFLGVCLSGKTAKKMTGPVLHYKKHDQYQSRSDIASSYKRAIKARIYIQEKYQIKYPESMKSLESITRLFIRMERDYNDLLEREKKYKNLTETLERKILIMKSSKFWKMREKYHKIRKYVGLDKA
jgi:glycosyltransferase involved in cell wall biosynthesis